jgi:hypothetical protein
MKASINAWRSWVPRTSIGGGDMIRNWVFTEENRIPATAANIGKVVRELSENSTKVHAVRGTVFITFPDEEFPGDASPLADLGVQGFLRQMFEQVPHLLYFLSDEPPLTGLNLAVAAFSPSTLTFDGDRVGFMATSEALTAIATLERNAVQFAREHGQTAHVVFGHLRPFDAETRKQIEQYASEI